MAKLTEQQLYEAYLSRNPAFDDLYFAAVSSTGLICRFTCSSNKAAPNQVTFYSHIVEGLNHGYYPCEVCNPHIPRIPASKLLEPAYDILRKRPQKPLKQADLVTAGINTYVVRNWFFDHYGVSFLQLLALMQRNGRFLQKAKRTAFIKSLIVARKRFIIHDYDNNRRVLLGRFRPGPALYFSLKRMNTDLGVLSFLASEQGLCALFFNEVSFNNYKVRELEPDASLHARGLDLILPAQKQIAEYLAGERQSFSVPLHIIGTAKDKQLWNMLDEISYGETIFYSELSSALNWGNNHRFTGNCVGRNPIPIIIPCHRVISKENPLLGFGGGIWRKKYLLDLEKKYKEKSGSTSGI